MKRYFLAFVLFAGLISNGQQIDSRKYIEVSGSAEMNVQPDEIVLEIVIGDYEKIKVVNGKNGIETIEAQFNAVMKKNHISPESVKFDNASYWYWLYWWDYRHRDIETRTVNVTLDKKTNLMQLVQDLNTKWTSSIRIVSTKSNDMARLRKEVKMEAIKAAKAKATYLLESVGEKIGGILAVDELPEQNDNWFFRGQNLASNSYMPSNSGGNQGMDNVKEIKLRYEIKVKFEIK